MTKINGSIFTILPWFGFTALGGFLATVFFSHAHKPRFRGVTVISFFAFGFFLIHYSSWFLMRLYELSNLQLFKDVAYYNYLFTRFGNVLVLFGIFYAAEPILKQSIVAKIGQKTLSIYVIHFIIIFGSFTGFGLKHFLNEALNPTAAIVGAILFMVLVCWVSFYYIETNTFLYKSVRKVLKRIQTKP